MNVPFFEAVSAVAPTLNPKQRDVLTALLFAPEHAATAGELRVLLDLSAVVQVNNIMGAIGRRVEAALGAHPDGLVPGEYRMWGVIATGKHVDKRGFVWQLRAEVVAALESCAFANTGDELPNQIEHAGQYVEGAVQQVLTNRYERDVKARKRCIELYGATCCICDFDFGKAYGAAAAGFIHVHHLMPLAAIGAEYQVNPQEDLRPVCANCHAVIHVQDPPRTVEAVRLMWASQRINRGPIS